MTVVAYVRVSTTDQNLDRQLQATHDYAASLVTNTFDFNSPLVALFYRRIRAVKITNPLPITIAGAFTVGLIR